jgi:surface protein
MSWMFCNAKSFNQDIGGWNVSKVEDMSWMFKDAKSFNHDLSSWDLSSVQYTRFMFDDCELKIPPRNYKLLEEYYSE